MKVSITNEAGEVIWEYEQDAGEVANTTPPPPDDTMEEIIGVLKGAQEQARVQLTRENPYLSDEYKAILEKHGI